MTRATGFATLLVASLAVVVLAGCEKSYNRADISSDGKRIAFALNKDGGFATDETSEIYIVDVADDLSTVSFRRLTRNRVCDAWADLSGDGQQLLYVRGDTDGAMSIWLSSDAGEEEQLSGSLSRFYNFPQFLDDDSIFFAHLRLARVKPASFEVLCQVLTSVDTGDTEIGMRELREIAAIPWGEQGQLWSTMPAFHENTMYYMVARQMKVAMNIGSPEETTPLLHITLHAMDMTSGKQRSLCDWTYSGELDDGRPVGMADLAISPDGKALLCCFLPGEGFELSKFDDQKPSTLFAVDLDDEQTSPEHVVNAYMYYPRFAPMREGEEDEYSVVFLSGAGFGEEGGRAVCITDDFEENVVTLASFPGKVMTAYTDWSWLSEERLRIFHICDLGLILVDTDRDGSNQVKRYLPREGMLALKRAADLDRGLAEFTQAVEYTLEEFRGDEEEPPVGGELFHYLKSKRDAADAEAHDVRLSTGDHPAVETPTSQPFDVPAPGSTDDTDVQK